jgi:hypothetical protein
MLKRKKKSKFTTEEIKTEIFNEKPEVVETIDKCPLADAMHIEEPKVVEIPEVVEIVQELSKEDIRALKRQASLDAQK